MPFTKLAHRLQTLILGKGVLACLMLAWFLLCEPFSHNWPLLVLLAICGAVGGACKVEAHVPKGSITMGFTVTYLAFLVLGTGAAMLVGLAGAFSACAVQVDRSPLRVRWRGPIDFRTLYNLSNCVVSIGVMGWVANLLGGDFSKPINGSMALPVFGSALAYYVANGAGVSIAIAWTQKKPFLEVFRTYCGGAWTGYLASASIGVGGLWAYTFLNKEWGVLLFMPLGLLVYSFYAVRSQKLRKDIEYMHEVGRLNDSIISSLAMAINAKDSTTSQHVNRVREYATGLGQKLNVTPDELQAVRIASLLHDIGKIGIPERILCKPGKLTSEEFAIMKTHVEIGAAILEQIQFPWPVVPIVMGHHERWDGLGYPKCLRGEEIPIGARIISLVDVYDALTSERPYRKAMSKEQAIQMLSSNSGTQFDPRVVETFIALLPEMEAAVAKLEEKEQDAQQSIFDTISDYMARSTEEEPVEVDTAALVKELEDLMERPVAPSLEEFGDSVFQVCQRLAPCASIAIYGLDPLRDSIAPLHSAGQWPELFDQMHISFGEGVSGYVTEKAEPVMNVAAHMDLSRRIRPNANLELSSALSVPLLGDGGAIGALTLYHGNYNLYQPYHQDRLEKVAEVVVRALRRYPHWMEVCWTTPSDRPEALPPPTSSK